MNLRAPSRGPPRLSRTVGFFYTMPGFVRVFPSQPFDFPWKNALAHCLLLTLHGWFLWLRVAETPSVSGAGMTETTPWGSFDVRTTMKSIMLAGGIAAAVGLAAPVAHAAPFGPASASITLLFTPSVTLGATSGSAGMTGSIFFPAGGTSGTLTASAGHTGAETGTVSFSNTVGTTVANSIAGYLTIDGYTFDLSSALTTSYVNGSSSKTVGLYLLGTMGGNGLTPTNTSITLTLNATCNPGCSAWSGSETLANPPAPPPPPPNIPEPMSIALLGAGLAGIGVMRRK